MLDRLLTNIEKVDTIIVTLVVVVADIVSVISTVVRSSRHTYHLHDDVTSNTYIVAIHTGHFNGITSTNKVWYIWQGDCHATCIVTGWELVQLVHVEMTCILFSEVEVTLTV